MRDSKRYRETREWVAAQRYDVWHPSGKQAAYALEWGGAYATFLAHGGHEAGARITVAHLATEEGQ